MAKDNRYLDLLDELNSSDEPAANPAPEKAKTKPKKSAKKPPTARAKSDPKMPRLARGGVAKSKNPDFEKGTYYLPKNITHKMRVYAATQQMEMSDLVAKAVAEYIDSHTP